MGSYVPKTSLPLVLTSRSYNWASKLPLIVTLPIFFQTVGQWQLKSYGGGGGVVECSGLRVLLLEEEVKP